MCIRDSKNVDFRGMASKTIDITYETEIEDAYLNRIENICREATEALDASYAFIVLSDRNVSKNRAPLSALIACGAVHHHLVSSQKRSQIGLIIETGEAREVHHHCLLASYGADAINPYLAFEALWKANEDGLLGKRIPSQDSLIEAYKKGELVKPIKPIVYYIDPATPLKWRPYFKKGIEDWNTPFEKAGFKNAIIAKAPPSKEEDPDWSSEDIRNSVFRYLASSTINANGGQVADPRSGEILQFDINWYHNVLKLSRDWWIVQTGAVNPEARSIELKNEIAGEGVRFIAAHEVGHCLLYTSDAADE